MSGFTSDYRRSRAMVLVVAVAIVALGLPLVVVAEPVAKHRAALVLYSYDDNWPWQRELRDGIYKRLRAIPGHENIDIYEERLDGFRLGQGGRQQVWVDYLRSKYSGVDLDLVMTDGEKAATFLNKNQGLFAEIPRFMVRAHEAYASADNFLSSEEAEAALFRTFVNILSLRPNTRQLVLIGNLLPDTSNAIKKHWRQHYRSSLELDIWQGFTLAELYLRAAELPSDAVILYELVGYDRSGVHAVPYDVAEKLAAVASAPVFVSHSPLLGSGVVGGYVVSAELTGEMMAEVIAGVRRQRIKAIDFYRNEFDSVALQRWGISSSLLPPDSIIRFREFDRQRWYLVFALLSLVSLVGWLLFAWNMKVKRQLEKEVLLRREAEEKAKHSAEHDELTGLPSLRVCRDRLMRSISTARRERKRMAVIFVDLNDFKLVNDTYGHSAGDDLLQIMTQRFQMTLREVDTIARVGGDEFLVILPEVHTRDDAAEVCRKLKAVAEQPVTLGEHQLVVTLSLGIACYPDDGEGGADLIQAADQSMYSDKRRRKRDKSGAAVAAG